MSVYGALVGVIAATGILVAVRGWVGVPDRPVGRLPDVDAGHLARRIGPAVLHKLEAHHWPGNVRELENVVERLVVFSRGEEADMECLPGEILEPRLTIGRASISLPPEGVVLEELEKDVIAEALERTGGNQTRAARFLHVSRNVLVYRMQKYGLGPYRGLPGSDGAEEG